MVFVLKSHIVNIKFLNKGILNYLIFQSYEIGTHFNICFVAYERSFDKEC